LNADSGAGSIGTLGAFDGRGDAVESTAGTLTTPGPIDLRPRSPIWCRGMRLRDDGSLVTQPRPGQRLDGLSAAAGVYTNLARPSRLPRHDGSLLASKLKLSTLLQLRGIEVVNLDDPAWCVLPPRTGRVTFGISPAADLRAADVTLDSTGSRFRSRDGSATSRRRFLCSATST
jgi:hypothetical protein